jgi:F420-dependent oxidoreductase-like protein
MLFSVGGSSGLAWQDVLEIARACDELGFYGFYPSDHLMQVQMIGTTPARLDAPSMLIALSGHTRRLRLGPLVLGNLFRHPVIVAKMFCTLDHASNGRAELGIGASWAKEEHLAHGFPYPPLRERLARLEEALAVITALWTQDRASFDGKYYQLHNVPFEPKPVQKPYPPIIIGGASKETLRIATRYADEWNILGPYRTVEEAVSRMRQTCQEAGRDFSALRVSHQMNVLLTDRRADVELWVERRLAATASDPHFQLLPHYRTADEQIRDDLLAGDADEVKAAIQRWSALGVNHFIFTTPRPFNRQMFEHFSAQVMPSFP